MKCRNNRLYQIALVFLERPEELLEIRNYLLKGDGVIEAVEWRRPNVPGSDNGCQIGQCC